MSQDIEDNTSAASKDSASYLKGSCLCGKIQYRVKSLSSSLMAHCHCTDCRKFHGSAFSTFAETTTLEWIGGATQYLQTYVASNGSKRQFCRNCGSSLTFSAKDFEPHHLEFSLATLDEVSDDAMIKPDAHVFVDSKVPWINIDHDGLPQHRRGRSS